MFLLYSAAFGFVLKDLENYFADNEYVQSVLAIDPSISLTDQFLNDAGGNYLHY